jgi:DNA-binding NtrC family response regulator
MKGLEAYPWPGNIRELRNAVERAMLLTESDTLLPDHFPVLMPRAQATQGVELPAGGIDLEQLERDLVVQALARTNGNQTRAAALLGLNRDQIRYRIEKFGLKA